MHFQRHETLGERLIQYFFSELTFLTSKIASIGDPATIKTTDLDPRLVLETRLLFETRLLLEVLRVVKVLWTIPVHFYMQKSLRVRSNEFQK